MASDERRPRRLPDKVDRVIIDALARDARIGVTELAEMADISRATAYNRIKRLTDDGVIRGYSAVVDHARMGLGITALILVSGSQAALPCRSLTLYTSEAPRSAKFLRARRRAPRCARRAASRRTAATRPR